MFTTDVGRLAEEAVIEFLQNNEYDVLVKNWKTKTCEIDIIAYKKQIVHFVEVKYRKTTRQGAGYEYINQHKLHRMEYAAQLWVCKNNWYGQYMLSGASVSGPYFEVDFFNQV